MALGVLADADDGGGGGTMVDVASLRDLLYRLNALVEDVPAIAGLDLNPVFVRAQVAVDVRIRVAGPPGE